MPEKVTLTGVAIIKSVFKKMPTPKGAGTHNKEPSMNWTEYFGRFKNCYYQVSGREVTMSSAMYKEIRWYYNGNVDAYFAANDIDQTIDWRKHHAVIK